MESAFLKFGKTKGKEILGAIIQDIAEKAGFKETFKLGKEIFKAVDAEKSTRMLASSYVDENKDDIVYSYINILKAIAEEFTDRILS